MLAYMLLELQSPSSEFTEIEDLGHIPDSYICILYGILGHILIDLESSLAQQHTLPWLMKTADSFNILHIHEC